MFLTYNPLYVHLFAKSYMEQQVSHGCQGLVQRSTIQALWSEDHANSHLFGIRYSYTQENPGVTLEVLTDKDLLTHYRILDGVEVPEKIPLLHTFVKVNSGFEVDPSMFVVINQIGDVVWYVDTADIVDAWKSRILNRITDESTNQEAAQIMSEMFEVGSNHQRLLGYLDCLFGRLRDNLP